MTAFNSVNDFEAARYEGKYVATVVANDDPTHRQRVKVTVPDLLEGAVAALPWIGPVQSVNFGYGSGYGCVYIPPVGAKVLVEFQDGDLHYGLMVGSVPGAYFTVPSEFVTHYPKRRGWKDPAGNIFFVDTTPGSNEIKLVHASGCTIDIDNTGKITITNSTQIDINTPTVNISNNVNIGGNLHVVGTSLLEGLVTSLTDFVVGAIHLITHRHGNVQNGGGTSGGPTP